MNSLKMDHIGCGFKLFEVYSFWSKEASWMIQSALKRRLLQASFHVLFKSSSHADVWEEIWDSENRFMKDVVPKSLQWTWVGFKMCFRPSNLLRVNFPLAIMIYLSCKEAISDAHNFSTSGLWYFISVFKYLSRIAVSKAFERNLPARYIC